MKEHIMDIDGFRNFLLGEGKSSVTVSGNCKALQAIHTEGYTFTETDIKKFLNQKVLNVSGAGYNHYAKAIKHYCRYLKLPKRKWEFVTYHKETPKERILLTDEEFEKLLAVETDHKYTVFWSIMVYIGMRPKEVRMLRVENIDVSSGIIYLHKTKTVARKVPITKLMEDILYPYLKTLKTEYLFPAKGSDEPFGSASYMKDWKKRLKILGIEKKALPYSTRKSFISGALKNGAQLFDIQDIVGHTNSNTTKQYYHRDIDNMRKAASMLPVAQAGLTAKEKLKRAIESFKKNNFDADDRFDYPVIERGLAVLWESLKNV